VYGIILAGWSSNSRYALLGAMRSAAQVISYELAMGLCLVCVLVLAGSLNLTDIVNAQTGHKGIFDWFMWPLLPVFVVYFISGVAETNRAPFDVAEGESEIVAGFHVEYSGSAFALFFLAEYANMILVSFLAAILFCGGWLSPLPEVVPVLGHASVLWLFAKVFVFATLFLWFRATFPRYRYDQIMRLGWKVFIPIGIVWVLVAGCMKYYGLVHVGTGGLGKIHVPRYQLFQEPAAHRTAQGHGGDVSVPVQSEIHHALSDGAHPQVQPLPRAACAAPLCQRRGTLHRVQAVRSGVPGAGDHHRFGSARQRWPAPHHAL
jgi:hypothetical protein